MEDSAPSEYYHGLQHWSVGDNMRNFDDHSNYDDLAQVVTSARTRNFVIDFDDDHAWCGHDLDAAAFSVLLETPRPPTLNTRWINIWLPSDQKETLEVLAKNYDFTPRLLGFMRSVPMKRSLKSTSSMTTGTSTNSLFHRPPHVKSVPTSIASEEKRLEMGSPVDSILDPGLNSRELIGMVNSNGSSRSDIAESMNPYFLANEMWHYSSVDWGRKYLCVGYNTLHNIPTDGRTEPADGESVHQDRPHGKRVWSWLILCEDRTVISIGEDPYPTRHGLLSHQQQVSLSIIRRNLINTFRQLSKARDASNDPAQMQLPLRTRLGDVEEENIHRATDVPGMLFYYLFDDWLNTYSLIARRDHRYARELDKLRTKMLEKADLSNVDRLHHLGRQLGVLKRLYQSYEMIIDKVLEKQEPTLASLKNSKVISERASMEGSHTAHLPAHLDEAQLLGVAISSAARVRFERLKHRIRLYALNEILECLDQKESLVMMNFNLIAIKESFSVERLTLVTLLLAKVTMLFMPVSLMSAYFSCQFTDASFEVKTYWTWFAIVLAVSGVGLTLFSVASGTTENKIFHQPWGSKIKGLLSKMVTRRKGEVEIEEMMF